jgi:surface antigen
MTSGTNKRWFLSFTAATALVLSACSGQPTQQESGMVIGGVLGGLLGAQVGHGEGRTLATIVGTLAGAAIGGAVGTGVPSTWRNPDTGNQYTVTPTRTYETAQGPCREYTVDAMVAGKPDKVYGTACRQADGSWRTAG